MPRFARLVVPGYPHHVTQRGNRRQQTFFSNSDYRAYLRLVREVKDTAGVEIWAYCLMPNHIHAIAVPENEGSLARLFGVVHHRYAARTNRLHNWRGHLWQERFQSFVMDEQYLLAATRYVELNPVRAGLCGRADQWRWSSVHAHLSHIPDGVVTIEPMRELVTNWRKFLNEDDDPETRQRIRGHTNTGRPAGDEEFVSRLEEMSGKCLHKQKPGPKPIKGQ
jgi:REP-associated tyrosine transposase